MTVKSRKNRIFDAGNASDEECIAGAFSIEKSPFSSSQEPEKTAEKHPYCVTGAQKGEFMRTGLTKQEKTTEIAIIPNSGQSRLYRKKYYPEIFYIALKMQ